MTNTPKRKRKVFLGCLLLIIMLTGGGVYLYAGWLGYQEAPKYVESSKIFGQLNDPYQLSSQQEKVLFAHGYPEGFTILFYEEEALNGGIQTVRLETWDYYTQRISYTFINGDKISEEALDLEYTGMLEPLPYYPEQFGAFMSLDEVIAAASLDRYVEIPLQKEYLEKGTSYFADHLAFGLKDNELLYIEALAVSEN